MKPSTPFVILLSLLFSLSFGNPNQISPSFSPIETDAFDDLYCRISPLYLKRMISHYGSDSKTIKQFDQTMGFHGWTQLFTSEPNSVCQEIKKSLVLAEFNFQFLGRNIPLHIKISDSKLRAVYRKDCMNGNNVEVVDQVTRDSILDIKNFFSKLHEQGYPLCDENVFTPHKLREDFALVPILKKKPLFNGTHCFSEWSSQSLGIGSTYIPMTLDGDVEGKISNHFAQVKTEGGIIRPPVFFPAIEETLTVTTHSDCTLNSLTWHLWKSKSTSILVKNTAAQVLELPDIGSEIDCNHNLIPDEEEIGRANMKNYKKCTSIYCIYVEDYFNLPSRCLSCRSDDVDENGVPDQCQDCNGNSVSDVKEIENNPDKDKNKNGLLDSCENPGQYSIGMDCNYDGHDDGVQIFWNPELDKDKNSIIDECEQIGICSTNGVCTRSSKFKCEKFVGGIWNLEKCLYGDEVEDDEDPILPGGTTEEELPTNGTENISSFRGSCVVSERECIDDIVEENCVGDWSSDKLCKERRKIGKIEDNENLKNSIDTFHEGPMTSTKDLAILAACLVGVLLFSIVLINTGALYSIQNS